MTIRFGTLSISYGRREVFAVVGKEVVRLGYAIKYGNKWWPLTETHGGTTGQCFRTLRDAMNQLLKWQQEREADE